MIRIRSDPSFLGHPDPDPYFKNRIRQKWTGSATLAKTSQGALKISARYARH